MIQNLSLLDPSANFKDSFLILRTSMSSLKIVQKHTARTGNLYYEEEAFQIHRDRFVPFYTLAGPSAPAVLPTHRGSQWQSNASTYHADERYGITHDIKGEVEILNNFLRAFTGYQVVFDNTVD